MEYAGRRRRRRFSDGNMKTSIDMGDGVATIAIASAAVNRRAVSHLKMLLFVRIPSVVSVLVHTS